MAQPSDDSAPDTPPRGRLIPPQHIGLPGELGYLRAPSPRAEAEPTGPRGFFPAPRSRTVAESVEAALGRSVLIQFSLLGRILLHVFHALDPLMRAAVAILLIPIVVIIVLVLVIVRLVRLVRSRLHPYKATGHIPVQPAGAGPGRGSLALASMICGILALAPTILTPTSPPPSFDPVFSATGVVLAIVSRVRIRRHTDSGIAMSTIGLVLSSLSLIILAAFVMVAVAVGVIGIMNSSD